jgi:hypothetical protein
MSAAAADKGGPSETKRLTVSAPKPCGIIDALSAAFDTSSVLLRRLFFVNADRTKYVRIGFYPSRNYETFLEFGGAKEMPVILAQQHVTTLGKRLSDVVQFVCNAELFT